MSSEYTREDLMEFKPRHSKLMAIDSDGCVFGTMDIKQKNHFHPLIVEKWGLQDIESEVRQVAEFVNLYSVDRGSNRFLALLKTFRMLEQWPEVMQKGVRLPSTAALEAYCESGLPLGNPSLESEVARTGDSELARVLDWSLAVNRDIDANMEPVEPFEWAVRALRRMQDGADVIVVSQTPEEALVKEWNQHGLDGYVSVIAGQELGTKGEHLALVSKDRYDGESILMVGDAPGDMRAAAEVGGWFYPINPRGEEESWRRLCEQDYDRFLRGDFDGEYQEELIAAYQELLPTRPPWLA